MFTWTESSIFFICSKAGSLFIRVLYALLETCFAARIALYRKTSYSGVAKNLSFSCVQDKRYSSAVIDKRPNSIVFNGIVATSSTNKFRRILSSDNGVVSTALDNNSGE